MWEYIGTVMSNEITLAPLDHGDLATLQRFRNSPEVYEHVRQRRLLTMADMENWWEMLAADCGRTVRMFAIKANGTVIGCAGLTSIDWINRRAELSVYTVPSDHEAEAARLVISHAFLDLGLYRIEAETLTGRRFRLCKELGFTNEGIRRDGYWRDGRFSGAVRWGLLADEQEAG